MSIGIVATSLSGCHRATQEDCEQILDRIVELELKKQGIEDPAEVRSKKQQIRRERHDDLLRSCVGRRVSESAMDCIRHAKTSEQITDECLK